MVSKVAEGFRAVAQGNHPCFQESVCQRVLRKAPREVQLSGGDAHFQGQG